MVSLIALTVLGPTPLQQAIDQAAAAYARLKSGEARIDRRAVTRGVVNRTQIDIAFELPNRVRMRVREPAQLGRDETDRTYFLDGRNLTAFDAIANERLVRKNVPGATLVDRLGSAVGTLEEPVRLLLDRSVSSAYLEILAKGRWKVERAGKTTRLTSGPGASVVLSPWVSSVAAVIKGSELRWSAAVKPGQPKIAFAAPASARPVANFTDFGEVPAYGSVEAKNTVRRLFRAYARMRSAVVSIDADDGKRRVQYDGRRFREDAAAFSWAYDGRRFMLQDRAAARFVSGPVKKSDLVQAAAAQRAAMDPYTRDLITSGLPFRQALRGEATAEVGGRVSLGGVDCTILNLKAPRTRTVLFVRADGLVQSARTDVLDADGTPLTTSTRRFTYAPASAFSPFVLAARPNDTVVRLPAGR